MPRLSDHKASSVTRTGKGKRDAFHLPGARPELFPACVLFAPVRDAIPLDLAEGFESERDGSDVVLPVGELVAEVPQRAVLAVEANDDRRIIRPGSCRRQAIESNFRLANVDLENELFGIKRPQFAIQ